MKNGPKIEPWGTPKITDSKDDLAFPPWTYRFQLERYDCISL